MGQIGILFGDLALVSDHNTLVDQNITKDCLVKGSFVKVVTQRILSYLI